MPKLIGKLRDYSGGDVTVFELIFTNSGSPPRRIIGHSDGNVTVRNLQAAQ
jgi:hypothetical protein